MAKLMRFALVLGLLGGCAETGQSLQALDSTPHTLAIKGFNLYERAQILRAVNEWNAIGARVDIAEEGRPGDMLIVPSKPVKTEYGLVMGKVAFINPPSEADFCGVAKHEIGHLLGLGHTPGGVMRASYGWWTHCDA